MSKFFWFLFILPLIIVKSRSIECDDRNTPFLKEGICCSSCTSNELKEGQCEIKNKIIKIQWMSNIIIIRDDGFRYSSIATSENNYLYFSTSSYPPSTVRIFYILDNEGFGSLNEIYINFGVDDPIKNGRFESEIFSIKLLTENSSREYLLSLSKYP